MSMDPGRNLKTNSVRRSGTQLDCTAQQTPRSSEQSREERNNGFQPLAGD